MEGLNSRTKFTISLVLSLVVLLSGVAVLAQEGEETQTPSEQVGEGAREVIEGVLSEYDFENEDIDGSQLIQEAESLIDEGLPPGTMVAVVKSLETGHLSPEELGSIFTNLEENVVKGEKPPGQVIKSIKTTYNLPEEVPEDEEEQDEAASEEDEELAEEDEDLDDEEEQADDEEEEVDSDDEGEEESDSKSNEADQDEEKNQNGKNDNGDDKGQPEDKGTSEDEEEEEAGEKGESDEQGPPEDKGQNGNSDDKAGPPEDEEGEEE